jgi:predicted RNase H-like nuclease (RuvC/YqgF family)
MTDLEQSKIRLKTALDHLSYVLETKYLSNELLNKKTQLEIENNDLRSSIIMLKKEVSELKQKLKNLNIEREQQTFIKVEEPANSQPEPSVARTRRAKASDKDDILSLGELKNIAEG